MWPLKDYPMLFWNTCRVAVKFGLKEMSHICCCDFQSVTMTVKRSSIMHAGAEVMSPYVKNIPLIDYSYLQAHVLHVCWKAAACKCGNTANMDFLIPNPCWDNMASWPKCPHQSEELQNNYLQQDPIGNPYIKALKATFDRMLHLLSEQFDDRSPAQFLSSAGFRRICFTSINVIFWPWTTDLLLYIYWTTES